MRFVLATFFLLFMVAIAEAEDSVLPTSSISSTEIVAGSLDTPPDDPPSAPTEFQVSLDTPTKPPSIPTFGQCHASGTGKGYDNIPPEQQSVPSHLKNFGYYHVACSTSEINDIPQLADLKNSNVMMLFTINKICLEAARKANIKVIAWTDPYVYSRVNPQYPRRGITKLKPDWEKGWNQFKEVIKGYENVIYAFYFEEPWWLGLNQRDFWTVGQRMMSDYPNIRRMAIEAGISMSNDPLNIPKPTNRQYYKYLTDIGVDWYGSDFTIFRDWNAGLYTPYLNNLIKLTSPEQSIWVVPQTFSKRDNPDFKRLSEILNQYFAIAQGNPRIIGMLNFLYSPAAVSELGHAAKEFFDSNSSVCNQDYVNLHINMGKSIINNSEPTRAPKKSNPTNSNANF